MAIGAIIGSFFSLHPIDVFLLLQRIIEVFYFSDFTKHQNIFQLFLTFMFEKTLLIMLLIKEKTASF